MIVRYISDLHLYDPALPYWEFDPQTRSDRILDNWNRTVQPSDLTFILGDIGYPEDITFRLISKLYGMKVLIRGNHDDVENWTTEQKKVFDSIHDYIFSNGVLLIHRPQDRALFSLNIDLDKPSDCYFHVPENSFKKPDWIVHGHLHTITAERVAGDYEQFVKDTHRLNCSADMIEFCPRTMLELAYYKEQAIATERKTNYGS